MNYYVFLWNEGEKLWYSGPLAGGKRGFHRSCLKAVPFALSEVAKQVADEFGGEVWYGGEPKPCRRCGSDRTVKSRSGDAVCGGCNVGVSSHLFTGADPIAHCSQCSAPIYNAELFRGPVCPRCGHWC